MHSPFFSMPSQPSSPILFSPSWFDSSPNVHPLQSSCSTRGVISPFILRRFSFSVDDGETTDSWTVPEDLCNPDLSLPDDVDFPVVPDSWPFSSPGLFAAAADSQWDAVNPEWTVIRLRSGDWVDITKIETTDLAYAMQFVGEEQSQMRIDEIIENGDDRAEREVQANFSIGISPVATNSMPSTSICPRKSDTGAAGMDIFGEEVFNLDLAFPDLTLEELNALDDLLQGDLNDLEDQDLVDPAEFEDFDEGKNDGFSSSRGNPVDEKVCRHLSFGI